MSWGRNRISRGTAAAIAAFIAIAATPAIANVLVVRAAGPSAGAYPPGRSLPDNARLTLRAGDSVIILGAGGTRTFRGPGVFSPSATAQAGDRTLASADGRRARIGAVRSAGIVPRSPTIWHIDVSQGGTFCLASTHNVMLWRPDSSAPVTLSIAPASGAARTARWPAGHTTLAWPVALPIANGSVFTIQQSGVAVPTQIVFRTLASEPGDLQAVAAALIANGCQSQLDVLVESQPDTAAPAG